MLRSTMKEGQTMTQSGIDWREVLFDLRRLDLMPKDVARELRGVISEAAVRAYTEEVREPSHVRGELILDLWCDKTGKRREDAPRRPLALRSNPLARVVRA
ncbi:TPA: hypothetical protein VDA67_004823 [Burkholderia vietnamiensis]|uniref:Uncharacterized protein n=3 Tax=Burkholderia vietnamiensis TaxID=60552 RepID=A0ABS1ARL8_BURVI|nr:hypothetical protein WJ03_13310 [Burkholderia vietnamiensis]MBJ9686812.1 hypothetical protein [Burkholderia vietnamiensis]HEP6278707.1 hypothetical protein [Burkholderia vietnamiensis]HEP6286376.1 hypothetical protein [Burkholderia vietnamiensis]HEP6310551.1 hypothetical protein [Burkholderia vietnamiensis]